LLAGLVRLAAAETLEIDEPWMTSGSNTGTVGSSAVTLTSSGDRWLGTFTNDSTLYARTDLFGSGAQLPGTRGDFASLTFGPGVSDRFEVSLSGPLLDPIFFIGDLDMAGASVTLSQSGATLTSNADGEWTGDTLTVLSGAPQKTTGAFATAQYTGLFEAGFTFAFDIEYPLGFSVDNLGIGIAAVPEPAVVLMLGGLLLLLARRARR
jgi:hypothetical protein